MMEWPDACSADRIIIRNPDHMERSAGGNTSRQSAQMDEGAERSFICGASRLPVEVPYEALARALGRPVYTHEIALNRENLARELRGDAPAPTLDEILALIPASKRIVILTGGE